MKFKANEGRRGEGYRDISNRTGDGDGCSRNKSVGTGGGCHRVGAGDACTQTGVSEG